MSAGRLGEPSRRRTAATADLGGGASAFAPPSLPRALVVDEPLWGRCSRAGFSVVLGGFLRGCQVGPIRIRLEKRCPGLIAWE
jgi:hypothetical protein